MSDDFTIHFLGSVTYAASAGASGDGRVSAYGQELLVNDALRQINTDRLGQCWLDLIDDEPAQIQRFGKVMFRRGSWPVGESRLEPGSFAWQDAQDAAMKEAFKIEDTAERTRRVAEVRKQFGPSPTSRTIAVYSGG